MSWTRPTYRPLSSFQNDEEVWQPGSHQKVPATEGQCIPMTDFGGVKDHSSDPLPGHIEASQNETPFVRSRRLTGWRVGAAIAVLTAFVALIINVSVGIWALKHPGRGSSLLVQLFQGDCKKVASMNTWTHLAINCLSTALLSGSNYCMQCALAPTRDDINRAHKHSKWLDIGVPSVHNLGSVGAGRAALWWALGLSSIPLHLIFNSAFYSSIATNDYNIIYATDDYAAGANFSTANGVNSVYWQPPGWDGPSTMQTKAMRGEYQRLDNKACIEAYAVELVTDRRHLIVVSNNASVKGNGAVLGSGNFEYQTPQRDKDLAKGFDPYPWICSDSDLDGKLHHTRPAMYPGGPPLNCYTYVSRVVNDAEAWAPQDWNAKYCLSETVPGKCGFNINLAIVLIVIICNVGKLITMSVVAFSTKLGRPLMTIGDAVSSFLDNPDESTENMCLTSKHDIVSSPGNWSSEQPRLWQLAPRRWYYAASKSRWWICISLFSAAILTVTVLLGYGVSQISGPKSGQNLWSFGFGQPHSQTMIVGWALGTIKSENLAITANVIFANLPQTILSFLYLTLNGLCTSMFLANEWSQFATQRKSLRVSQPKRHQRNSYFLQLPYRIAVPLITTSGLLHWLVSQSVFLAVVTQWDELGVLKKPFAVITCGFSPFAMIFVIVAGAIIVAGVVILSLRRFDGEIPLVGSCSAAISAACHGASWEEDEFSTGPLQWGVVAGVGTENDVGHCSFSSGPVEKPVSGVAYAGSMLSGGCKVKR